MDARTWPSGEFGHRRRAEEVGDAAEQDRRADVAEEVDQEDDTAA